MSDERPDEILAAEIERWREAAPPLDPVFEARVLAALEADSRNPHPVPLPLTRERGRLGSPVALPRAQSFSLSRWRERAGVRVPRFLLAAGLAGVLAGAFLTARAAGWIREAPGRASGTMLIAYDALEEVREAEERHRDALVRLQVAAQPILARADDPDAPAREAAMLLAYRERLRFLDATIADVVERVEQNPYNTKGRAVLLAAYREKSEVLREVLVLAAPPSSIGGA